MQVLLYSRRCSPSLPEVIPSAKSFSLQHHEELPRQDECWPWQEAVPAPAHSPHGLQRPCSEGQPWTPLAAHQNSQPCSQEEAAVVPCPSDHAEGKPC